MNSQLDQLRLALEPYFTEKAPFQLPEVWRQNIVRVAPWIVLIIALLSILPLLTSLALVPVMLTFAAFGSFLSLISLLLNIGAIVTYILSFPGLKSQSISGWNFLFYSSLLSAASSVVVWLGQPLNVMTLVGAAIVFAISMYFLFQIREYYTGKKKLVVNSTPAAAVEKPTE